MTNKEAVQPDVPDTAVIDTEGLDEQIRCEMCRNPMHTDRGCDGNCKYDEKLYERIMQILGERIKRMPSAQPEQRWIPCNDRLPEDGERVLATHLGALNPDRQVIEHIYKNEEFTLGWDMDMNKDSPTFGQRYMGKVVAWMPLPEPYTEKREE